MISASITNAASGQTSKLAEYHWFARPSDWNFGDETQSARRFCLPEIIGDQPR
jgi:hypothetical protein